MSKIGHLLAAYRELQQNPRPMVLATIVETVGSTYQKPGARMLIAPNGELTGLLGGGCFEQDLVAHAQTVFANGSAKSVFYDMRTAEDEVWGLGNGCNGAVRIFLQLLREEHDFSPLNLIAAAADSHRPGVLVTVCESEHPDFPVSGSLLLDGEQAQFGDFAAQTLPAKSHLQTHVIARRSVTAFHDWLTPPLRLLILGAGADAEPLLACAKMLGWNVAVADHRPGYLSKERFSKADVLIHLAPHDLSAFLHDRRFDATVLMTHNLDYDRRFLAVLASSAIGFIGLLGPVTRRERLLHALDVDDKLRSRLYGPVGLDLGAETPDEIALSIVAGILAALSGRGGGQLRELGSTVAGADICG